MRPIRRNALFALIGMAAAIGLNGCDCEERPDGTLACELDCDYWDCDSYQSARAGAEQGEPLLDGEWQVSLHRVSSDCGVLPGEPAWSDAVLTQTEPASPGAPAAVTAEIYRPATDLGGTLTGEVRPDADGSYTLELAGSRTLPGACPMRVDARLRGAAWPDGAIGALELRYVPLGGAACPTRQCRTQGRFEIFRPR